MRRSEFSDDEILVLVEESKRGVPIAKICETAHVSIRTFYRWRRRFGGMTPAGLQHLSSLEAENRRLKRKLALAGEGKQLPLQKKRAKLRTILRAECGMYRSSAESSAADLPPESTLPDLPVSEATNRTGAGALTGRFAHLRSGSSRR